MYLKRNAFKMHNALCLLWGVGIEPAADAAGGAEESAATPGAASRPSI